MGIATAVLPLLPVVTKDIDRRLFCILGVNGADNHRDDADVDDEDDEDVCDVVV
jgi:hypothetical protein